MSDIISNKINNNIINQLRHFLSEVRAGFLFSAPKSASISLIEKSDSILRAEPQGIFEGEDGGEGLKDGGERLKDEGEGLNNKGERLNNKREGLNNGGEGLNNKGGGNKVGFIIKGSIIGEIL